MIRRLNGWQRLWVVVSALWAFFVLGLSALAWSTNANVTKAAIDALVGDVPDAAIRERLTPVENASLTENDLLVAKFGGRTVNPYDEPNLNSVPEPDSAWQSSKVSTRA